MLTETLRTPTPDGDAEALLLLPDQRTPAPLVVFLMDAFGLRPALTDMAARLVSAGYAVLQPNLYWRSGPFAPFDARTTFNDAPERTRIFALMNGFTAAQVGADLDAHLAALADHPAVRPGPVGLLGYCMGGRQAFYLAAHLGARAAAMASIHGGGLVKADPSSPHLGASRIRARCYFAVADRDNSCTEADCVTLGESLTGAGVTHTIELYPDALHGFAAPDMSVFDAAASERHWTRVLALFAETLGG
jgi:carboxymethylenebutenolidase